MGAAPRKTKQRSAKRLQTTSLGYSIAKSTLQVPLTFNKAEKTKREKVNFVHLLSSSSFFLLLSSVMHNSKTIRCMQILYIPNDFSATEHLPFLVWGGVRATTGELRPRNGPRVCKTSVFVDFWGFCLRNPGVERIVRPHPDYWTRVFTVCDEFSRQLPASRSWTTVFSIYLMLKTILVPRKTPLCI